MGHGERPESILYYKYQNIYIYLQSVFPNENLSLSTVRETDLALYTVHCTLYTVHCTLYTVHYTVHCTCTLYWYFFLDKGLFSISLLKWAEYEPR